ncbi:hypothetical protein [Pseudomonas chlororaphis]|uniref:hypothetical protein n=1 Tax=Pseudomonas chlororaphis TaxID=587753 RepID=UPI0039E0D9D5
MNELCRSVEMKLARAESQARSLSDSVLTWVTNNPLTAESRLRDGRFGFQLILNEYCEPPPLDTWGLAIGECVHNLRSALDNLAYALARLECDPPAFPGRIAFPIFTDKASYEANGRRYISQLPQASADLVERLQPFQRDGSPEFGIAANDPLVLLQWLNNADKHRVPSVVLIAPTELTHNMAVKFYSDEDASANVPPDTTVWAGPLEAGVTLIELRTTCPIESVSGQYEGYARVAIQYEDRLEPIGPMLVALHKYTALVVSQFNVYF